MIYIIGPILVAIIARVVWLIRARSLPPKNIYEQELHVFDLVAKRYYRLFMDPETTIARTHADYVTVMNEHANEMDGVIYNYLKLAPKLKYVDRMSVYKDIYQQVEFMTMFLDRVIRDQINQDWTLTEDDYTGAMSIFRKVLIQMVEDILKVDNEVAEKFDFQNIHTLEKQYARVSTGG